MIPAATIQKAKSRLIENVIAQFGLKLRKSGAERIGPCPRCAGRDRFAVNVRKQVFNCRGCRAGGDVIALVQFLDRCSFREACAKLTGESLGGNRYKLPEQESQTKQPGTDNYECRQRDKARWLWRASQAAAGTLVDAYLRKRLNGSTKPLPATVRYLPPLRPNRHPAMIVPYGLRAITAVQLTLLKPDGSGKAEVESNKITIASPAGMPMVIAPTNDLLGLAITEGVEDALSVHHTTGLGVWASGGASLR